MRKSYLLLLFFIVNIYSVSHLPGVCLTDPEDSTSVTPCDDDSTDCPTATNKAYDGKCYTKVEKCEVFNPNYDACYKCEDNYELYEVSGVMKCRAANCQTLDTSDPTKCTTCKPSFTKTGDLCTCTVTPVLATDGTTMICPYDTNCVKYGADGICTQCIQDYKLDTDTDTTTAPVITGKKKCVTCSPKGSNGVTCLSTTTAISDCIEYDSSDNGKCKKCGNSKFLQKGGTNDGKCVACATAASEEQVGDYCYLKTTTGTNIENCIAYDGTNCVKCNDHMKVKDNACSPCYSPYTSFGDLCLIANSPIVDHCKEYEDGTIGVNAASVCKTCEDNYTLSKTANECIPSSCTNTGGGNGGDNNNNGGGAGTNTDANKSGNADGSDGNMMRLNIIYMAIMLMIIV